jgi:transposase
VTLVLDPELIDAFRSGRLTEAQAQAMVPDDLVAVKFLLLQLSAAVAPKVAPHAPPSATPPFVKAVPKGKRRKSPGAKPGHKGHARPKPERIDHHVVHQAPCCPACQGRLTRTGRTRTRIVEDLPADLAAETTEHTIHRDWCPTCKKQVEPVVPDAMPACTLGHRAVAFSAYLHYALGTTTRQVVDVFNAHLQLPISDGGLTQMWHRLADTLAPWSDRIAEDCRAAAVLHADETGWHQNGELVWLWCFCTPHETYYRLDESRGHAALNEFFKEAYDGVLVTDFWRAYDAVEARTNQKCWAHLLRELTAVDDRPDGARDDWPAFAKQLRRIYTDAVTLAAALAAPATGPATPRADHDAKVCRLHTRLTDLAVAPWTHPDAQRLANRLRKDETSLLTFAEIAGVPPTNNLAEREIRPAVLMRKASYGSASARGRTTRAVLMTVLRTLKRRGHDPLATLRSALETHTKTGQLPPLPGKVDSGG